MDRLLGRLISDALAFWTSLTFDQKVAFGLLIITVILLLFTIVLFAITWMLGIRAERIARKSYRLQERQNAFPFEYVGIGELPSKAGILSATTVGVVEGYVERPQVQSKLNDPHFRKSNRVLITGTGGVGKSREAVEIINRLDSLKKRNIYFARSIVEPPTIPPQQFSRHDVVVFIDDVLVESESRKAISDEGQLSLPDRVGKVIRFFEERTDLDEPVDLILTMRLDDYQHFRRLYPEAVKSFSVIEIRQPTISDKVSYLSGLTQLLGIHFQEPDVKMALAKVSTESLGELYNSVYSLRQQGKKLIDQEDVETIRQNKMELWRNRIYPHMGPEKQLVFRAISLLVRFNIPVFRFLVVELCVSLAIPGGGDIRPVIAQRRTAFLSRMILRSIISRMPWDLSSRRFTAAINRLNKRWLIVRHNTIYCHESRLFLEQKVKDELKEELRLVRTLVEKLCARKQYENHIYSLLSHLAAALLRNEMPHDCIRICDQTLQLPDDAIPVDANKARAALWYYKGRSYYSLGPSYWGEAVNCYVKSLELNDAAPFTKHALASLYIKQEKGDLALRRLDEITRADNQDLLAYKTKLDAYCDYNTLPPESFRAYRRVRDLLRRQSFPLDVSLSAEFACVRFSVALGECFGESSSAIDQSIAQRRFEKASQAYEKLIKTIPSGMREVGGIVRNAYGCFLHDVLQETDHAIAMLEEARSIVPEHMHTLNKLAAVYLDQAETIPDQRLEYFEKASECLATLLRLRPKDRRAMLAIGRLHYRRVDWAQIDKSEFWLKVSNVYQFYRNALASPDTVNPGLHNSVTHHATGVFLWHIEFVAAKRDVGNRPQDIPSAEGELLRSFEIEKDFSDRIPNDVQNHLILAYQTLGSYYLTIAKRAPEAESKGREFIERSFQLARSGGKFGPHSKNSYAESYVGWLFFSVGELDEARSYFDSAIKLYPRNWNAWWWLGRVHEISQDYEDAIRCFSKSVDGQNSPVLYGRLRGIIHSWVLHGKVPRDWFDRQITYSEQAWRLDPQGGLNIKNITDYAYDLLQEGRATRNIEKISEAEKLFRLACQKSQKRGLMRDAEFAEWYTIECRQAQGSLDGNLLRCYLTLAAKWGFEKTYEKLKNKVFRYCSIFWDSNQLVPKDLFSEIEACVTQHLEYPISNLIIGVLLYQNREDIRALPYLEKGRACRDKRGLRGLMTCYYRLGKGVEAEQVCQELYPLLDYRGRKDLEFTASQWGLRYS